MVDLKNFLELEIFSVGNFKLKVLNLFAILIIFVITRIILLVIKRILLYKRSLDKEKIGNYFAVYQIIRYLLWSVAIGLMLDNIGIKLTVLLAGSAALLVGIGLGLQNIFNDFLSGIILLSDRSIKIGDILQVDNEVIKIEDIGIRTSKGFTRDDITIIIPNSQITSGKVINWSHQSKKTRFKIKVGVAYGSNVELVMNILKESVIEHPQITDKKAIESRFTDFGSS